MSLFAVLEVVIGLSFLFATLSVIVSGVNEMIAAALGLRAKTLVKGVEHMLDDPVEATAVFQHPVIRSFSPSAKRNPSYVPADKFTLAFLDTKLKPAIGKAENQAAAIAATIQGLPAGRMKDILDALWRDAKDDADKFRTAVEGWFDDTMERVSGWYRREVQWILMALGLVLAVALNVNTLTVTQRLWTDPPVRAAVVEQAERATPPPATDPQTFKEALANVESGLETIDALSLPIGWATAAQPSTWYLALAGWALTAIALSLGAPFWFDVLNRVARLRTAGVRPPTSIPPSAGTEAAATGASPAS